MSEKAIETKIEKKYKLNPSIIKRNLAIAALTLTVTAGANFLNSDPTSHPEKIGQYNEDIKTVELFAGANLRETPNVDNIDGGNLVAKLDHDVTVEVTGGSYEKADEVNSKWTFLDKQDILTAEPELKDEMKNVEGVWVNGQKTDVEYADSEQ